MTHENPKPGRRATDQEQDKLIEEILTTVREMKATLEPIANTYRTVSTLGKWGMAGLVLLSVVIGILIGLRNLLHRV